MGGRAWFWWQQNVGWGEGKCQRTWGFSCLAALWMHRDSFELAFKWVAFVRQRCHFEGIKQTFFFNVRNKAIARRQENVHNPPHTAFALSSGLSHTILRILRWGASIPRPEKACVSLAPHSRWNSIPVGETSSWASCFFSFFLSECDVGASKAVVNGLAPGSNGQDKGKAFERKPDWVLESVSRRSRGYWAWPDIGGNIHWSNQAVSGKPVSQADFLKPWACSYISWVSDCCFPLWDDMENCP